MSLETDSASARRPDAVEHTSVKDNNVDPAAKLSSGVWNDMKLSGAKKPEVETGTLNFDEHPSIFPQEQFAALKTGTATDAGSGAPNAPIEQQRHAPDAHVDSKANRDRQTQVAALDASVGDQLKAQFTNPATVFGDAIDTAHNLINAKPGDHQKIFEDAAAKFTKENPKADGFAFQGVLENALRQSSEPNTLRTTFGGALGEIHDTKAITPANPKGLVASAFLSSHDPQIDTREKAALSAEQQSAQILTDAQKGLTGDQLTKFGNAFNEEFDRQAHLGLTTPRKDIDARVPSADTPGFAAQVEALKALRGVDDKLAQQAVYFANQLAFSKPKDIQKNYSDAIQLMQDANPTKDRASLAVLISDAQGKLGETPITMGFNLLGNDLAYFDQRLGTPSNPNGYVATTPWHPLDADSMKGFEAAQKVGAVIGDNAKNVPNVIHQQNDFRLSVLNLYDRLRTE
ncbi:MAG: hypothetical protein JST89_20985 [Cyanobacteria bacterium SZAS-4]|nr:hypothetical protein [Cyanobacteria bacterium SZAS-4]